MLKVADIMTSDVLTLHPDLSIRDAMERLSGAHVSGAPVMSRGMIVGVVSASDLLTFAASLPFRGARKGSAGVDREEIPADDEWMGEDLPPATYFVEQWEDAGAESVSRFEAVDGPEWDVLQEHTVSEVMTQAPICQLAPTASAVEAAEYMTSRSIHRVLVVDGERLVGIVTSTDIARAAAENRLVRRTYVFGAEKRFDDRGFEEP